MLAEEADTAQNAVGCGQRISIATARRQVVALMGAGTVGIGNSGSAGPTGGTSTHDGAGGSGGAPQLSSAAGSAWVEVEVSLGDNSARDTKPRATAAQGAAGAPHRRRGTRRRDARSVLHAVLWGIIDPHGAFRKRFDLLLVMQLVFLIIQVWAWHRHAARAQRQQ